MSAELLSEKTHTAKKQHCCGLCGLHIEVGVTYTSQFVKQEGDVYSFKMHKDCEDIAKHYASEYDDDGYDSNCFSNDVLENFKEITGVERNGLSYKEAVELFKESWIKLKGETK